MQAVNEILHSIGFNWHVALANFINFLIILYVLNRFFFKNILNRINERDKLIRDGVENARIAEKNLEDSANKSEEIILASKKEAEEIVARGMKRGDEEAKEIRIKAEEQIANLKDKLNLEISNSKANAYNELELIAPELLKSMLTKVLINADDATHKKLIESALKN